MRVCHGDWIERPSFESEPLGDKKNVNLAGVTVVGAGDGVGVAVGGVVGAVLHQGKGGRVRLMLHAVEMSRY